MKNIRAVIIDYGSGNLHSAKKAFVKALQDNNLQGEIIVTNNSQELENATHIVIPGVGAFGDCIAGLKAIPGMITELEKQVLEKKKPFLGICVGMQMLAEFGFEDGKYAGLGWIKGDVEKIPPAKNLRIPHMGWNNLRSKKTSKLLDGFKGNEDVYFVHSYYFNTANDNIVAVTDYGHELTAIVEKDNIMGVQFHPEKSQQNGIKLIGNFLKL